MNNRLFLDESSFKTLFDEHYINSIRIIRAKFHLPQADVEDIVQEAFIRLWKQGYTPEYCPKMAIVWYAYKEALRKRGNLVKIEIAQQKYAIDMPLPRNTRWIDPEPLLWKAFRVMPRRVWDTFRLVRWRGLSTHDVASILKVTQSAIEDRLSKADKYIRHIIEDCG